MARTIEEIKKDITDNFMSSAAIRAAYGFNDNAEFNNHFSAVSIESVIFYIVAVAVWSLEKLFDIHTNEVETILSTQKPHRLKWYRDKTLAFQVNYSLPVDSDVYEVIDEDARVVKYAAAVEPSDASKILIKIAGGDEKRDKLPDEVGTQVSNYLNWIKDAGVRIDLVNQSPDFFRCEIDIYYNAMFIADDVKENVRKAINNYIENLPFNGEYSNMTLIDILQNVEGVIIPELKASYSKPTAGDYDFTFINAKKIPDAGYFRAYEETDIVINMQPYELLQD